MNPQQLQALEGFAQQRDKILADISNASKELDRVKALNNSYLLSNASLQEEITLNKKLITELLQDSDAISKLAKARKEEMDRDIQQRANVLNTIKTVVNEIETTVNKLPNVLSFVQNKIDETGSKSVQAANLVNQSKDEIRVVSEELRNTLKNQVSDALSQIEPIASRLLAITNKEKQLYERELALQAEIKRLEELIINN